jgi:hypothetical protein
MTGPNSLEVLMQEDRRFPAPVDFAKRANINDPKIYKKALRDNQAYCLLGLVGQRTSLEQALEASA